jgi:glycosyltransferase involved in cell wall biosynthesis
MKTFLKNLLGGGTCRPAVLTPASRPLGTVALSYIAWPLREGWDLPKARGHTNAYEAFTMAEAWREAGFRVEVVDHGSEAYQPPSSCSFVVDLHSDLERWETSLPEDCHRILHATGSHWLVWNQAEMSRLAAVRDRKGIALTPRRQVEPSRSAQLADTITVLGNHYTSDSFAFAGKPTVRVPISSAYELPWPQERDFSKAKHHFLWVGSYGMIHKGLDLVLDAFADMPELTLTVCGRPEKEQDFFRVYEKELTKTPNIQFHGWLDMGSPDFSALAQSHATIIYPSSAEGGAGSVIHCMHAGLLPACTHEASVDLLDFGVLIQEGRVNAVKAAARFIASLDDHEVEARARAAWEHARTAHTRALFRENYQQFVGRLLDGL